MDNSAHNVAESLTHDRGAHSTARTGVFAAFSALAWYNAIELIILCLCTFRHWKGAYFWSLLIASACIIPHCLGFVLLFFSPGVSPWVSVTLVVLSWYGMVTGESVVLWSRLHLVVQNRMVLRGVLWMICVDAVLFHIPTTVVLYGAVAAPDTRWGRGYDVMERVQLVGFCVQESIISGIYVWETIKLLRLRPQGRRYGILNELLIINLVILMLDIAVVAIEYVGFYAVQVMFKPVAYSIKLKLEYAILGKLVAIARCDSEDLHSSDVNEMNSSPSDRGLPSISGSQGPSHRQSDPEWSWETGESDRSISVSIPTGALSNP
ncbi:hypothetical protein N7475_003364 [Penicillium sp. IBT 31633x]|nr:hypothetical protein N7475_003364 [Penicillium sp. IBT 31633x]